MNIFNEDCIFGSRKHLKDQSIDLMICDPPFGINEGSFSKHYKRNNEKVIDGYKEAPKEYEKFTFDWMTEAKRVLKDNGSFYIISGHTNLAHILNVADKLGLVLINHIIWKFNFGVYTSKKFVTSHYHILYYKKSEVARPTFNAYCRYGASEVGDVLDLGSEEPLKPGKRQYADLEDVWLIAKEYSQDEKNSNKLPEALLQKIILYSSNIGDEVCDFFLGNFTTAVVAKKLGRNPSGFELNINSFIPNMTKLNKIVSGEKLKELKPVTDVGPPNQGTPITDGEIQKILKMYKFLIESHTKRETLDIIGEKFGRGYWSVIRIIEEHLPKEDIQKTLIQERPSNKELERTNNMFETEK